MLGHIGVSVDDLGGAKSYYDQFVTILDFELWLSDPDQFAYRPAGETPGTYLFLLRRGPAGPLLPRRGRAAAPRLPGPDPILGPRRPRARPPAGVSGGAPTAGVPQYPPPHFATFWLDPHGFLLEAVCQHDRD